MSEAKNIDSIKKENPHKGHRAKVKKRYLASGFNGMPDHNILELLLFFGIPYKDTNEIAHHLINRFGSFSGVLEAKPSELVKIKGMTENAACLLSMILPLYKRYSIDINSKNPYYQSTETLAEFIRSLLLDTTDEKVFAFCFDNQRCLTSYKVIGEGDINSSVADFRKLAELVLETKTSGVIIAHNHPHGITSPSRTDIDTTKEIFKLLNSLKVRLLDHIIVNDTSHFSMAESLKYAYIFAGMEKSPLEKDIDEELEYLKAANENKRKQENIERVHKILEKAKNK